MEPVRAERSGGDGGHHLTQYPCTHGSHAVMALPGGGWLGVLGGSILACALAACQQAMQRHSGLCMRQAFARAFGAVGGRIMAAAELLWLLFAASGAAAASQIAFEDDLGPFLPAIPLLLAALAGQKGRLAAGRVCAVLALCLAGLYAVIAAASLRHMQVDWSRPQGVPADAALAFCLCLGPVCMAVVTAEALPDEAVQRLQTSLADYAEDANGDGAVIVQINNYTWSADAALTDMNGQMAGATQMNTDLANGESKIWILDDPEGFEQAYGALSEKLGAEWQTKLIPWRSQPALSGLELGSYNTAADGSQTVDVQSRFAGYSVAVVDASDALWQALNS